MKKILFLFLACACVLKVQSQDFFGASTSNYGGLYSIDYNPANMADNRLKFDLQLFGLGYNVGQNFIGFKPQYLVRDGGITSSTYPLLDPTPPTLDFTSPQFKDNRSAIVTGQIQLPSLYIAISDKYGFSISGKQRNYLNIDGVDRQLYELAFNSLDLPSLQNIAFTNDKLSVQAMSWMEYGFGFGAVVHDGGEHFVKVGGKMKALFGLTAAYLYSNDFKFEVTSDTTITLVSSATSYGVAQNFEFNQNNVKFDWISRMGLGFDFGAVYEWRPKHLDYRYDMDGETNLWRREKNKYKLKVGVSLNDLGGIKFKKGNGSGDFTANVVNWDINNIVLGDTTAVSDLTDTLNNRFGIPSTSDYFKMNLPTALNTNIDFQIWRDLYISQTNMIAFGFSNNPNKVIEHSVFAIIPRWDHRVAGVSVPISYSPLMGLRTGLALRFGPITAGASSLYPYTRFLRADGEGSKDIYGADFYMSVHIPIAYKRVKDSDKDKVSNRKDNCPDVPGTWEFMGCSDRDNDHIRDEEDACPDVYGLKELQGCPDKDGDGVTDLKDDCVDVPGLKSLAGCPDQDNDGIADGKDDCPTETGLAQFNGCPDRDGDGIMDKNDDCPDDKGLVQFNGCPDRDEDGVMDKADNCPDVKGLVQLNGCPDQDGDGIIDQDDLCPTEFGIAARRGCPAPSLTEFVGGTEIETVRQTADVFAYTKDVDTKQAQFKLAGFGIDTVTVVYVSAPNLRGKNAYKEKDGYFRFPKEAEAVVLKEEEKEVIKKAFNNLEFETAKDVIKPESLASLNELANLLVTYPNWKLRISGHTDNKGKRETNLVLSKKRADAVKRYLMTKGLPDSKFEVLFFGPDQPIAPNDTEEGRALNRRVEMLIVE
ncbi:MAG: OmpA family protein [Bacteroidetes bacterium]|nr:OmpA family protein [Bacteroidota bacterium]